MRAPPLRPAPDEQFTIRPPVPCAMIWRAASRSQGTTSEIHRHYQKHPSLARRTSLEDAREALGGLESCLQHCKLVWTVILSATVSVVFTGAKSATTMAAP